MAYEGLGSSGDRLARLHERCERTIVEREGLAAVAPAVPFVNGLDGEVWRAGTHLESSELHGFLANVVGVE